MSIDWIQLLSDNHVPFVTQGANVSRGLIAVKCPFCLDDPSEHLAIRLNGRGWWCWRNREHRGSATKLVMHLLHVSYDTARRIVGHDAIATDNLLSRVQALLDPQQPVVTQRKLKLPDNFKTIFNTQRSVVIEYMRGRGYDDLEKLRCYDLRYVSTGSFGHRIIFPVRFNHELVTWTGRSIYRMETLRYKSLSPDPDKNGKLLTPAKGPISDYLLWFDHLLHVGGSSIILTEGPFDALRVDYLGRRRGIRASCFFTAAPSEQQLSLLHQLLPRFTNKLLLLDRNTTATAMRVAGQLSALGVRFLQLPEGVKDPGEMSAALLHNLLEH